MRNYKHYQTKEDKLRFWGRFFGYLLLVGVFIGYPFMMALSIDTYTGYFDPLMFGFLFVFYIVSYFSGYAVGREHAQSDYRFYDSVKSNENVN